MFGHKSSQNDVKQHHQFLRPPFSGFSGSATANEFESFERQEKILSNWTQKVLAKWKCPRPIR